MLALCKHQLNDTAAEIRGSDVPAPKSKSAAARLAAS